MRWQDSFTILPQWCPARTFSSSAHCTNTLWRHSGKSSAPRVSYTGGWAWPWPPWWMHSLNLNRSSRQLIPARARYMRHSHPWTWPRWPMLHSKGTRITSCPTRTSIKRASACSMNWCLTNLRWPTPHCSSGGMLRCPSPTSSNRWRARKESLAAHRSLLPILCSRALLPHQKHQSCFYTVLNSAKKWWLWGSSHKGRSKSSKTCSAYSWHQTSFS